MELYECINFLLTAAQHKIFKDLSCLLLQYDITPVQYGVLHCLWRLNKMSPKEMADELKIENSTISGILDRMEKKELIIRKMSESDRRFIIVALTEKGRALEQPVMDAITNFNQDALSGFHPEEQNMLKRMLRKIGGIGEG